MAPVILALRAASFASVTVLSTGQHREMTRQTLATFHIEIDQDLDVMVPNQSLAGLSSRIFSRLDAFLEANPHDLVLVQGDTTSVMIGGLVAFYRRIPIGHVEAGLRTYDLENPFPEELNRVVTSTVSTMHFAPTETARKNLIREGIKSSAIHVTGNTVIDSLMMVAARSPRCNYPLVAGRRLLLLTVHRRESFGLPIQRICDAVVTLLHGFPDIEFVCPVHPNPNVAGPLNSRLAGLDRVHLIPPADYTTLVSLMQCAHLILTDSGGIQEEAPALGKPVLVLRFETERPEAVKVGAARLVGTDTARVVSVASELLGDECAYQAMASAGSPYGDGRAAGRIAALCRGFFQRPSDNLAQRDPMQSVVEDQPVLKVSLYGAS
jgi:UDP-N-acetylglucosamine 2-epimerase (non-hydrolysing)